MEPSVIISTLALLISGAAAWATFYGPKRAAEIAEQLRTGSAKAERREAAKSSIFFLLMQERAAPYTFDAVKAFNLIDVTFVDCEAVQEAWRRYFALLDPTRKASQEAQTKQFNELLAAMASEVGLSNIRMSEIERVYAPGYVVKKLAIDNMQTTLQEDSLKKALAQNAANTTPQSSSSP